MKLWVIESPKGEGTPHPALRRVEALRVGESAAYGSPSPWGEGWGEGEETLRNPAQWRIADGVDYTERRKAKLHASQSPEPLAVASPLPPHPAPLPQGEGTPHAALRRVEALRIGESAAYGSPSPRGEGRGEGEETLRTPARLRIADEVGCSERRNTKLHARQSDESLAVASRLPPHPSPLPQGEGTAHPALRRVEALWIGESVACGSPSPGGEGLGEGGLIQNLFRRRACRWNARRRSVLCTGGVKPRSEALAFSPLHHGHGLS